MKWADQEHEGQKGKKKLLRFYVTGRGDEWSRLQEKIYSIIDSITERIQVSTDVNDVVAEHTADTLKDLSSLAAKWAQAKIERPSLENEKLKAEIASEFAEAKRRHAESLKLEAETRQIDDATRNARIVADLDNLERLMKLASTVAHVSFAKVGKDGHLLIGPTTEQIGIPDGDSALIDTRPEEPEAKSPPAT